jgi:hypothetical protein
MSEYEYDVFLSHNSRDKPTVEWLAGKLTDQAGLIVFLCVLKDFGTYRYIN